MSTVVAVSRGRDEFALGSLASREGRPDMYGQSMADGPADPIDRAQWELVLDEVGARALSCYAASYLELLSERLDGLERAVAVGAWAEALRIMADLRTSSAMLGAGRLAILVARAEAQLKSARVDRRQSVIRSLHGEALAVQGTLRSALAELSGREKGRSGHLRSDSPEPPNR